MRAITRRAIGVAVGVGSFTAAITMAGTGVAQAHGGKCDRAGIEHSIDDGQTWTHDGRMDGDKVPTVVKVRLTDTERIGDGCTYNVSLASYSAEGPKWENSGTQAFLGFATTTLSKKSPEATLDVSQWAPECFGQIDLYGNNTKYDGSSDSAALPHYPDSATPTNLITAWNGGQECQQSPSPSPSDETTSPTTPSTSPSTDTPSTSPSTDTPSTSPSTDTPSPSGSPTTSAPAVGDSSSPSPSAGSTAPPTGTPSVPPADSSGNLAETGGNGTQTATFAAGGAVLLLAGGAAVFFTRRRHSRAH
ncbi:LAETG motif-containing sortase-dependent surface protein [Streptomyces sp. NPDC020917]|uniref:LAETG motif-containing sortase-dependent surface protein n=1 Tax=Streptomyces sp. NPDC020917 TaxID=3365102 RepID=UPI0037B77D07